MFLLFILLNECPIEAIELDLGIDTARNVVGPNCFAAAVPN